MTSREPFEQLMERIRGCQLCAPSLAHGVRPVLQAAPAARILIAGQAPGRKVHETGIPFDDASGRRLRQWMGVSDEEFYDGRRIAIVPMGFCYPGSAKSGDLPPRSECAPAWREELLRHLDSVQLTLVLGAWAQRWHLGRSGSVTELVRRWRDRWPTVLPLPHPSPRNVAWFQRNPWFEDEVVPALQQRVRQLLDGSDSSAG